MHIEKPDSPLAGPGKILSDFGTEYMANAFVAFIFAASAPVAVILTVGTHGGLSEADIASWLFGSFFINGLITIGFCWFYRQPLSFFWTIPGTVLVGPALTHLTFPEVIGAYIVTGLLMFLLGLSGWVRRAMDAVPMPIVMAMVAGIFLRFALELVFAIRDDFWIAAPMTAVFLLLSARPGGFSRIPPLIGALLAGVVAVALHGSFDPVGIGSVVLARPDCHVPVFSWKAMVELVVPLAITVLAVHNGQGIAVLKTAGHRPPINAITAACGAGSIVAALFGTVSTCLTGPVNAIISGSGKKANHYTAGLLVGALALFFGLLSPVFVRLMLAAPPAFIASLAGLAMLRVLQSAFSVAFRDRFTFGALLTFVISVANVPIFNIGAPFWGLVFGFLLSRAIERDDFRGRKDAEGC